LLQKFIFTQIPTSKSLHDEKIWNHVACDMVMLAYVISEDLCRNCAVTTHCAH